MSDPEHKQPAPFIPLVSQDDFLHDDEVILIVDDYPDIAHLLQEFLLAQGLPTITAGSVHDLHQALQNNNVSLTVLDIGLPDGSGTDLLPGLKKRFPDMSVIMLSAVTDLHIALECMREGADDYMTKPVQFTDFFSTVRKVLEKRRLALNNRRYQRQVEQAHFRINFLHQLTMKMNSAYLSMVELDEILQAVLIGITAEEGLGFNRAFLALFNKNGDMLEGKLAIGPGCRDEAGRIWQDMHKENLRISKLIERIKDNSPGSDSEVNATVRSLRIDANDADHLLIRAVGNRKSIHVINGKCDFPVPQDLIELLQEDTFVVVPLYSPGRSLGVIIADHFVTRAPISGELISALESFASQASLAIEHCHLYMDMETKIRELETMGHELEKNKDMLVEAERFSALGHMAAQLVHSIRNPITAIGGTARLLARKNKDPEQLKFLNMMTSEAAKIEATLQDLCSFVDQEVPTRDQTPLYPLIRKSLALFYNTLQKKNIAHQLNLPEPDPTLKIDAHQFRQMLVHLIRNAVEAMSEGGTLTVEVTHDEQLVNISIRDTGTGIPERIMHRATDPFFTTKTFGTGMGLTLVNRIAEDHDATLDIKNIDDGGTEALLRFRRDRSQKSGNDI